MDVRTLRGVCILRGDYGDKNRGVFSTDLESEWYNKETMEPQCKHTHMQTSEVTQVVWKHNLILTHTQRELRYILQVLLL